MMTSGNVQACQFKSCKSVFLGWHQGSDQRAPDSGRAQRAAPEPAEVAQGGLGSHEGRDRRDDHGSHPQGECPTGARQVQDLARGPKGQHQAPSRPVRKHVNVGDDVDEDCKEKTKISDLLWRVAKHERNYLKKFFPQTNPKLLFVPTKVEANLFEVDKDRQETGGEDQQSLTMKKNLDKVSKCLKKNLIASAWFCRCRLYSRVASSRPKCLVLWSFFSSPDLFCAFFSRLEPS